MSEINPVEFGALRAEVIAQRRDLDRLTMSVDTLTEVMEQVRTTMDQARGGWRAIAWVAGIASTLGGVLTWFLQYVRGAG